MDDKDDTLDLTETAHLYIDICAHCENQPKSAKLAEIHQWFNQIYKSCNYLIFSFFTCSIFFWLVDWTKASVMKRYRLRLFVHKSDLHFARGWRLFVHPHPDWFWIGQPVDRVQGGSKLEISSRPDSSSYRCHLWQVVVIIMIIRRTRMVIIMAWELWQNESSGGKSTMICWTSLELKQTWWTCLDRFCWWRLLWLYNRIIGLALVFF